MLLSRFPTKNCLLEGSLKIKLNICEDTEGATLVEFSMIVTLLLLLTFSFVEFGILYFQHNNAQKATQLGAREASTRLMITGVEDCWVASNEPAGTECASVNNANGAPIVCTGGSSGNCDSTGMAAVITLMQSAYPSLEAENIQITFAPTSLGYVGRGRPVPAITVEVNNITYDYVVIGALYNVLTGGTRSLGSSIGITSAKTTVIGEDIREGAS